MGSRIKYKYLYETYLPIVVVSTQILTKIYKPRLNEYDYHNIQLYSG